MNKVYISVINQRRFAIHSNHILKALNFEPFYLIKEQSGYAYLSTERNGPNNITTLPEFTTTDLEVAKKSLRPTIERYLKVYRDCFRNPITFLESSDKTRLNTNINFFSLLGTKTGEDGIYTEKGCMAITRQTYDTLDIYIPTLYLYNYGYREPDLLQWLSFLEKAELLRDYNYIGKIDNPFSNNSFNMIEHIKDIYYIIVPFKKFFHIRLNCSENKDSFNYCQFMPIRYIYSNFYHTIPRDAMKIKALLGNEISYQQAFIIAHLREKYYYYYSYFAEDLIPDINQNLVDNIENADGDINSCFKYINTTNITIRELRALFKKERFLDILNILKNESRR